MSKFETVSYQEYQNTTEDLSPKNGVLDVADYQEIQLPKRATKGSAGYDFYSPIEFKLGKDQTIAIPTGIKCKLNTNEVLLLFPRSSYGIKYKIKLDNTCGIVDSDYYNNEDNEGHIWFFLTNDGVKPLHVKIGDRFAQGLIMKYETVEDDNVETVRIGGFGSTSK